MVNGINCESCSNHSHDHLKVKRHEKNGHACDNGSCPVSYPHGHTVLSKVFPFEEKIKGLKVNNTVKQLLTMISNLTPAIGVSEIAGVLHTNSFIASPLAISAMHLTNRGINQLPKLFFTALSSVGILSAQKFADLPRIFTRPIMALAVFFIEKNGKSKNHIKKSDWINLLKLQGQINTVPWLANLYTTKLKEVNEQNNSFINKFLGHLGISTLHIAGLSNELAEICCLTVVSSSDDIGIEVNTKTLIDVVQVHTGSMPRPANELAVLSVPIEIGVVSPQRQARKDSHFPFPLHAIKAGTPYILCTRAKRGPSGDWACLNKVSNFPMKIGRT